MEKKINGIRMNFEIGGLSDAPAVVFSHSLGSHLGMWNPQKGLLEPRFKVLYYDTRGHGLSETTSGSYTFDLLAEDVVALLDELEIDQAHFVGLSMGGMIGQNLALRHAARFRSFVLCDTAAAVPEEAQPVWRERIERARREGMEALLEETLQRWFTPDFLSRNPEELQQIRRQFLNTSVEGYVGCAEAIRNLDYMGRLSDIDKPTLIIVGEEDPGTPVDAAKAIHDRIAGSRLEVIPSAAHLSSVEQPEAFNNLLSGFLMNRIG
jgi:3-oxoadipate enol-lactonase